MEQRTGINNSVSLLEAIKMFEDIQSDYIWDNFFLAKNIGLPNISLEILNFDVVKIIIFFNLLNGKVFQLEPLKIN